MAFLNEQGLRTFIGQMKEWVNGKLDAINGKLDAKLNKADVDDALNLDSSNPVQNQTVSTALNQMQNNLTTGLNGKSKIHVGTVLPNDVTLPDALDGDLYIYIVTATDGTDEPGTDDGGAGDAGTDGGGAGDAGNEAG